MADPKHAKPIPISDVLPGNGAADGTSRGAIVTNRPMMKDPLLADVDLAGGMVPADAASGNAKPADAAEPVAGKAHSIDPPELLPASTDETGVETQQQDAASSSEDQTNDDVAKSVDAATPEPTETEQTHKPAGDTPTELDLNQADVKSSGIEPTPEQQQIIDAGTYDLPIVTAETRRIRREVLLTSVAILVIVLLWLDMMLDAGLIRLGNLHALTNLFH